MPGRHPHSCVNDQFRPADEAVQRQRSQCKGEVLQCKHCGWVVIRNATMMRNHVLEGCDEFSLRVGRSGHGPNTAVPSESDRHLFALLSSVRVRSA